MGLLDFIFGKDPGWGKVSKDTFSTEDTYIYSKGEQECEWFGFHKINSNY